MVLISCPDDCARADVRSIESVLALVEHSKYHYLLNAGYRSTLEWSLECKRITASGDTSAVGDLCTIGKPANLVVQVVIREQVSSWLERPPVMVSRAAVCRDVGSITGLIRWPLVPAPAATGSIKRRQRRRVANL